MRLLHYHLGTLKNGARARIAAPAAMQDPLRVWKKALSRYAFAPGKSEVAARRLDDFGIARRVKWSGVWELHPPRELHGLECFGYTTT